jgi:hypothetical protein
MVVWDRSDNWWIADRLEGTGTHYVEAFFHFAPASMRTLREGIGVSMVTDAGVHAVLQARNADLLQVDWQCGGPEPEGGWIATGYGRKAPAPVVKFYGNVQLPCEISFRLTASLQEAAAPTVEQMEALGELCDLQPGTARSFV